MPVDTRHYLSESMLPSWKKAKDTRDGQTAIHKGAELYLPRLSSQDDKEYKSYRDRAGFYGATSRSIDAFKGMILRREPTFENKDSLPEVVTQCGDTFFEFLDDVFEIALVQGFGGILVDHPKQNQDVVSKGQAEALGIKPYMALYEPNNIYNWKYEVINNVKMLTMVVLEEKREIPIDKYESELKEQYRVLILEEGVYRQEIYEEATADSEDNFILIDTITPLMNGKTLDYIPFYSIGDPKKYPPLLDLIDVNINHYRVTADYENASHFTGLPTPIISGVQLDEDQSITIGSTKALVFAQADAKAYYLEYSGSGISALQGNIELKEKQMGMLGARMLIDDRTTDKTVGATVIKSTGEFSALAQVAMMVDKVVNKALDTYSEWMGVDTISMETNKDFIPTKMDSNTLRELFATYQGGGISYETFWQNLKEGEIVMTETSDDEMENIKDGEPALGAIE